ncbi:MAG: anaerobic ribonucleoside-triphosphate reductase [Fusobacteriaceae bacterium]
MYVEKKNGDFTLFDGNKIKNAILKASFEVKSFLEEQKLNSLIEAIEGIKEDHMTVEQIQDEVVDRLMKIDSKTAKAYQSYRAIRHESRKRGGEIVKEVNSMLGGDSEKLSENANKDPRTLSVQRDLLAGFSSKEIYMNYVLPKHISQAHKDNRIHIHDLDYLLLKTTNCELVDLERMLKGGCKIGNADMDEPKSIEVAVGHAVQIVAAVSSNTFGGCTIPYIDRTLTPYIRKTFIKHYNTAIEWIAGVDIEDDKETKKEEIIQVENAHYFESDWAETYEYLKNKHQRSFFYAKAQTEESVKQALQGLEYEINSLSTINGQTPFSTIGLGTEVTWEGRLVQKHILRNRAAGFGKDKKETAIFPKIAFAVAPGHNMNPEDHNYDMYKEVHKCMSKAIYPDIVFVTKEEIENDTVVYPMGCRAYLSKWVNEEGKETYNGRFNICATSINLPRIAIESKGDLKTFYSKLDEVLDIVRENSVFRAKYMEDAPSDIAPILWQHGALAELKPGETIKNLIWGGYATISIGYIGLSEVSKLLFGKDFSQDEEIYKKTYAILSYLKAKAEFFKKEDNLGYAIYGTPKKLGA